MGIKVSFETDCNAKCTIVFLLIWIAPTLISHFFFFYWASQEGGKDHGQSFLQKISFELIADLLKSGAWNLVFQMHNFVLFAVKGLPVIVICLASVEYARTFRTHTYNKSEYNKPVSDNKDWYERGKRWSYAQHTRAISTHSSQIF